MYDIDKFPNETVEFLTKKQGFIVDEFFDKNILGRTTQDDDTSSIKNIYQNIIHNICIGDIDKTLKIYMELSELYIKLHIPYITLLNEQSHLKHIIIELLISYDRKDDVISIYKFTRLSENTIAKEYLQVYTNTLISMCNNRLSSLGDMVEKFVVEHYADHLKWLVSLSKGIQDFKIDKFPQTDKTLCEFGVWLITDAKQVIKNNSKLKELDKIHSQLHYISLQIKHILLDDINEYDVLLTYLEKAELLSLSIGTELALIDNTIINQKATKDTLTGALGRQVLEQLFQNQYELSFATNTNFVIAICDLDHFKNINDTYGHIYGDKMLKNFVTIVKDNIRTSDIVIRYGGEEFILILPAIEKVKALNVLEKIRRSFEEFELIEKKNIIKTTVSIGMLEIEPKEGYNKKMIDQYIDNADSNLYKAKQNGRNNIK